MKKIFNYLQVHNKTKNEVKSIVGPFTLYFIELLNMLFNLVKVVKKNSLSLDYIFYDQFSKIGNE